MTDENYRGVTIETSEITCNNNIRLDFRLLDSKGQEI